MFFEKWQYTAFNPDTWNVGYYNDYVGEVEIYLLDRKNQRKYGLKLHDCYPKSIAQTELSYGSNNEIIKISIDMNFKHWTTLDKNQETKAVSAETVIPSYWPENWAHKNLISSNIPATKRNQTPAELQRREEWESDEFLYGP